MSGDDKAREEHISALHSLMQRIGSSEPLRYVVKIFRAVPYQITSDSDKREAEKAMEGFVNSIPDPELKEIVKIVGNTFLKREFFRFSDLSELEDSSSSDRSVEGGSRSDESKECKALLALGKVSWETLPQDIRLAVRLFCKGVENYRSQLKDVSASLKEAVGDVNENRRREREAGRRVQDISLDEQTDEALMWLFRYGNLSREMLAQRMRIPYKDAVDIVEILGLANMIRSNAVITLSPIGRFYATAGRGYKIEYRM